MYTHNKHISCLKCGLQEGNRKQESQERPQRFLKKYYQVCLVTVYSTLNVQTLPEGIWDQTHFGGLWNLVLNLQAFISFVWLSKFMSNTTTVQTVESWHTSCTLPYSVSWKDILVVMVEGGGGGGIALRFQTKLYAVFLWPFSGLMIRFIIISGLKNVYSTPYDISLQFCAKKIPDFRPKCQNLHPNFHTQIQTARQPHPSGAAHTYIIHIWEYPPPLSQRELAPPWISK